MSGIGELVELTNSTNSIAASAIEAAIIMTQHDDISVGGLGELLMEEEDVDMGCYEVLDEEELRRAVEEDDSEDIDLG